MRLLLTRPEPDAQRTAAALRQRGHTVIIAPLMRIESLSDAEIGVGPWAAILITSANAAHAIAAHPRKKALAGVPVFAVGDRSAQAMRDSGFADVSSADGGVGDLARLVGERMTPGSSLLYLAGAERSGDLAAKLGTRNFAVQTTVVYRAVAAARLPRRGSRCVGAGHRGRVALLAPHRRGLCERGPQRRVARKRAKARPLLSVGPNRRAARCRPAPAPSMLRSGPWRPR